MELKPGIRRIIDEFIHGCNPGDGQCHNSANKVCDNQDMILRKVFNGVLLLILLGISVHPVAAQAGVEPAFIPAISSSGMIFPLLSSEDLATVVKAHLAHLRFQEEQRRKSRQSAEAVKKTARPADPFRIPEKDARTKVLEEIARDRSGKRLPDFERPAITFASPAETPPAVSKPAEPEEEEDVVEIRPDLE